MTNDRTQGLLIFNIKKPYKISVDGQFEERTGIICHEMNSKISCNIAGDLDQLLTTAFFGVERKSVSNQTQKQIMQEEKEDDDFYNDNSPTPENVKERADQLHGLFKLQFDVPKSKLLDMFEGLVAEKLLSTEGDIIMYGNVWDDIDYEDKIDIMFRYIVFFANPLQSLSQTNTTDGKGENTK